MNRASGTITAVLDALFIDIIWMNKTYGVMQMIFSHAKFENTHLHYTSVCRQPPRSYEMVIFEF